jgi:hypothetical protein
VIDEAVTTEQRAWADWTDAMSEEARRDLERLVLDAPESLRTGLSVTVDADRIATVTTTLVRIRADRD